jgi:hypothetical protein
MDNDLDVDAPAPSETWMVKPGAVAVGVPEMRPFAVFKLSPAGSEPDTAHERGAVPPDTATGWEYAVPMVPPGNELVVIDSAAATEMESALEVEAPALSATWMVKPGAPAVVGVPVMAPVLEFRLNPAGSEPADTVQLRDPVPPVALTALE